MELQKGGDGDHSTEMQSALKRFEDVCNSLEDEHTKLLELEKRRQKLNEDLERLRNEIKEEKKYFLSVIGEQGVAKLDDVKESCSSDQLGDVVDPLTLDTGAIKEFIQNQRNDLATEEQEVNLERLKESLKHFEESYFENDFSEMKQQRQEAAAKPIRQHMDQVVTECNMDDLEDVNTEMLNNSATLSNEDVKYQSSDEN